MKTFITLIAATLISTAAAAETVTFYTGGEGGGYDAASRNIAERLEQRSHTVEIENRNGADDITLQACGADKPAMWIAQKDALYQREMLDGCFLPELAIYGTEYAMIFFPPDSRIDELDELDANSTILVDRIGSGSELTWKTMVSIEQQHGRSNDWSEATLDYSSYGRAPSMASRGTIQAVFMVRTLQSNDVTRLLTAGFELGYLYDKDINDLEWNGQPLYEAEKVAIIREGRRVGRNWAYIVPSLIGTNEATERNFPDLFDAMISAAQ